MKNDMNGYINICKRYGWEVNEDGNDFVLSRNDLNNREYSFHAAKDNFPEDAAKAYAEFNSDDYAYHSIIDYVLKNNGEIPHIQQEVHAADFIRWSLKTLSFMLNRMANPGESITLIMNAAKEAGFDVEYCPNCSTSDSGEDLDAIALISGDIQAVAYCSSYTGDERRGEQLIEEISGSSLIKEFLMDATEFYENSDEQLESVRIAAEKLKKMQAILHERQLDVIS